MAARIGPLYLVQLLLNKGASPNTRNNNGIHSLIALLASHQNIIGEVPLDLAMHVDIIATLKKGT